MDSSLEPSKRMFETFQPICVGLAKDQTRDNVKTLQKALQGDDVSSEGLQELQKYVLFPLRIILKQPKKLSEELYTDVCTCMSEVLSRTRVHGWEMCQDILSTLSILISSPANYGSVSDVSEEMKSAVVKCLDDLLKSSHSSVIFNLYKLESIPMLGHLVSILLSMAQNERARQLRLQSINCLLTLMRTHCKDSLSKIRSLGDTFASFLPGMSMGLCKVITGDSKQGQMITVAAIEAWKQVVILVMGDNSLQLKEQTSQEKQKETKDQSKNKLTDLKVKRECNWVKTTSSNLLFLVKEIVKIRDHSSWKVRSALVDWAEQLLINCTKSLSESVPVILEVLVGMLGDEYETVAAKARKGLESFSHHHIQGESGRPLVEILEDNLYSLATSLPREIRTADDSHKLSILNLLSGYIQLLGPNTCGLLRSLSHLKRLSKALVQVLEFDCTDIKITEDLSHITEHGASALHSNIDSMIQRPRKYFKHFSDERISQELMHICRLLGYYGDVDILVDHFLDVFHETQAYRLPSTLILNEILVGTVTVDKSGQFHENVKCKDHSTLESIVRMLIEEYLSPGNFGLKISNVEEDSARMSTQSRSHSHQLALTSPNNQPLETLHSNILQICLFLEGFGKFSQVLCKDFSPLLIKVLYPVMEKLGDENGFISTTAYLSLQDICTYCGYRSVSELLQTNSDYLVNSISVKLRHLRQNPRAPLVLKVMLQHSSSELLPLVQDTIQEVLSSLDLYYGEKAVMFMKVLNSLVLAVEKWYPPNKDGSERLVSKQGEVTTVEELVSFFTEYHKNRLIAEGDVDLDDNDDDEAPQCEDRLEDEDTKPEPPQHIIAVKEVLLRSKHLLSSHNPRLRLLVLDTISHATTAMTNYQNELLPLVHQIWSPFVERFNDEEKVVTLKAFQTLTSLAVVCGDFIMKRTIKSIFPKLTRFLRLQTETSLKAGPAYKFTTEYKLQLAVLSDLGKLCSLMGVDDIEIETVAKSCLPYISARQPAQLQQACLQSFEQFMTIEADSIWLMLNQLYCPEAYTPPSDVFPLIKFEDSSGKRNEFTDNVKKLLTKLR